MLLRQMVKALVFDASISLVQIQQGQLFYFKGVMCAWVIKILAVVLVVGMSIMPGIGYVLMNIRRMKIR